MGRVTFQHACLRFWIALALLVICLAARAATPAPAAEDLRHALSLDGPWSIAFDRADEGRAKGWSAAATLEAQPHRAITIPRCWEEIEPDYEGVAWLSRRFDVPADWKGRAVRLRFGAVNYFAEVWVNDRVLGDHEGGYTPFEFDVSDLLQYGGENTLVVRVVGPAVRAERSGHLLRDEAPHWRGGYVGGIWQSVELLVSAPVFTREIFVEPRLGDSTARVHIDIENITLQPVEVEATLAIAPAAQADQVVARQVSRLAVPPGGLHLDESLPIANPHLWSPEDPHLYVAQITLASGAQPTDEAAVRFGMREFTVQGERFLLNGKPIFLKCGFWEGQYPSTLARIPDLEVVRKEIRLAKEAGLNLLRPWRHPTSPGVADLADEMGILLMGSPPIECMNQWPALTPQLERRWTSEMEQLVRRDRNHPSIILWETGNEVVRRSLYLLRHKVSLAARRLDPTRLIIDESGGDNYSYANQRASRGDAGLTFARGPHIYLPGSSVPESIHDYHLYLRAPVNEPDYQKLAAAGQAGLLNFISEVGYGGFSDFPRNMARYRAEGNPLTPDYQFTQRQLASLEKVMDEHKLREIFPDASALCLATQRLHAEGNRLQLEALRVNPKAAGYCLHAFTDGDWVVGAGVLDLWREPKLIHGMLKEVNRPLYLAVHADAQTVYAPKGTRLTVTAVNEGEPVSGELTVEIENGPLHERRAVTIGNGIQSLHDAPLQAGGLRGACTVIARLTAAGRTLAESRYPIWVFAESDLKPAVAAVTLLDKQGALKAFFEARGVACREYKAGEALQGPAVIALADAAGEPGVKRFAALMEQVRGGATAIWLQPPGPQSRLVRAGVFPLRLESQKSVGLWIPALHYMRPHPVFAGLPAEKFMTQLWRNVAAKTTMLNLPGAPLAGTVSHGFTKDYTGPTDMWHGTDLAVLPCGKGRIILSKLELLPHLGADPVADKLLLNLCAFASGSSAGRE